MLNNLLMFTLYLFAASDETVTFYTRPDFGGEAMVVTSSQSMLDMPEGTGSLFVPPGYMVELFSASDYEGQRFATRKSIADMATTPFATKAPASLRLTWLGPDWPDLSEDTTVGVTLFTGPGMGGDYQVFQDDVARLDKTRLGKQRVVSALVAPGYQAVLYTGRKFNAERILLRPGRYDLSGKGKFQSMRIFPESAELPLFVEPAIDPVPHFEHHVRNWAQGSEKVERRAEVVIGVVGTTLAFNNLAKGMGAYRDSIAYDHGVILFNQSKYRGKQLLVTENTANLADTRSGLTGPVSLVISPKYKLIAYSEPNFQGASTTLSGKVEKLDQPIRSLKLIHN